MAQLARRALRVSLLASLLAFVAPGVSRAIERRELLVGERPVELLAQRVERLGARSATRTAHHDEPEWPVEARQLLLRQRARQLLGNRQSRDSDGSPRRLLDVIADGNLTPADVDEIGKREILVAHATRHDHLGIDAEPRPSKIRIRSHVLRGKLR